LTVVRSGPQWAGYLKFTALGQEGDACPRGGASPTKSDSLSGTRRTKRAAALADDGDGAARARSSTRVVPVSVDAFDDDDGLLGEIVGPEVPTSGSAFELVPDDPDPVEPLEDLLGALAEAEDEAGVDLDDILEDTAAPLAPELDTLLEEQSGAPPGGVTPDPSAALAPAEIDAPAAPGPAAPGQQGADAAIAARLIAPKLRKRSGGLMPRLSGTREISHKAYAGGLAGIVLLTCVSVGQAAIILARPVPTGGPIHHASSPVPVPAVLPINYATVDLERFIDKTRSLSEGGRQILRNPVVKEAIVGLDGGEQLYRQIETLAAESDAADRATIRHNRVHINSCDAADCGDRAFQLTYDIERKSAVACLTEKYLNGAFVSSRYSPDGYQEVPHCGR
jgi:hypothetical protein